MLKNIKATVIIFVILGCILNIFGQVKKSDSIDLAEYLKITSVQLIVRAIKDGNPVGGLKASDFSLYENRKKVPITSCREIRRQIGETHVEHRSLKRDIKTENKGRFFLFYYCFSEPGLNYLEALDYFFTKVFRENDRVLLVVKDRYFWVREKQAVEPCKKWLKERVDFVTGDFLKVRRSIMNDIEGALGSYVREMSKRAPDAKLAEMFKRDLILALKFGWEEYRNKFLLLNYGLMEKLAEELRIIKGEKWVLVFYKEGAYPVINYSAVSNLRSSNSGAANTLERIIRGFENLTNRPDGFQNRLKKIQQYFINDNTTFHFLYLPPVINKDKSGIRFNYANFQMERPYSGWRQALRGITEVTGGEVVRAARMGNSMKKVVNKEDIYYQLTYSPKALNKKKRKIEIKVLDPKIKVFHLERVDLKKNSLPRELRKIKLKSRILVNYPKMTDSKKKAYLVDSILNNHWARYFVDPQLLLIKINRTGDGLLKSELYLGDTDLPGKEIEICLISRNWTLNEFNIKIIKKVAKRVERINFTPQTSRDYYIVIINLSDSSCFYNAI
jgi:hypothetical protein